MQSQSTAIAVPAGLNDEASVVSSVPIMSDVLDTLYFSNFTKESSLQFIYDRWKRLKRYPITYYRNCEFYKRANFTGKGILVLATGAGALVMFLIKIWLVEWTKSAETVVAVSNFISFAIACLFMIFEPKKKEMRNESAGDCYEDLCEQLEIILSLRHIGVDEAVAITNNPENTSQDLAIELEDIEAHTKNQSPGTPPKPAPTNSTRSAANSKTTAVRAVTDEEYLAHMVRYLMRRQRQLREKFDHLSETQLARAGEPVFPQHLLPEVLRAPRPTQ